MLESVNVSVLVVAPETGLEFVRREVEAIVNTGLEVYIVPSPVTKAALARELRERRYDVWCILTHGVRSEGSPWESGILLEDDVLQTTVLATYAKVYKPALVFLNTCSSDDIARIIMDVSGADVVCSVLDVPDEQAFITGRLFMEQIADHGDYRLAYENSRPADNRTYLYLTGFDLAAAGEETRGGRAPRRYGQDDEELARTVEALVRVLQGDDFGGTPGLLSEIKMLRDDYRSGIEEDRTWKQSTIRLIENNRNDLKELRQYTTDYIESQRKAIRVSKATWLFLWLTLIMLFIINVIGLSGTFFSR